ncbi:hypothetical protein MPLSOD_80215 [Mesorhizobium sp. SOD10]|nr:hypothetical protein MPLSOD_80215 [Mesorhizobium sp. SOD10]
MLPVSTTDEESGHLILSQRRSTSDEIECYATAGFDNLKADCHVPIPKRSLHGFYLRLVRNPGTALRRRLMTGRVVMIPFLALTGRWQMALRNPG